MRYLIKLTPLEPFLFGGENTFGKLDYDNKAEEVEGTYLVVSRQFPQQSAILGMLRKEIMTQGGFLTRKIRGEWVDKYNKIQATNLVGDKKFDMSDTKRQNYGSIKTIEPLFLIRDSEKYIKKVDSDSYPYKDGKLEKYNPKVDIYDNFVEIHSNKKLQSKDIFIPVEQTGNKKGGEENSLFKKTSYLLEKGFSFAFYLECDFELHNSIISLGADRSSFKFEVQKSDEKLNYIDKNGYLTLLSDSYITLPIKEYCDFAITSEISFKNLQNKKHYKIHNKFEKSETFYLYEKGSIFINPKEKLIENLNNKNCQQIGYNIYTYEKGNNE